MNHKGWRVYQLSTQVKATILINKVCFCYQKSAENSNDMVSLCKICSHDLRSLSDTMTEPVYKVIFQNQNEIYEVYAKHVYQSDMYGFVEIEEIVFGENSQMIVDPSEEKLKNEFKSVTRSYIPMHSLIRIDEVEKEGVAKISESLGENVTKLHTARPIGRSNSIETE